MSSKIPNTDNDLNSFLKETNQNQKIDTYYNQVDIIKAFAIISIVLGHTITHNIEKISFWYFHMGLSVPFFCIVMGFNMSLSFKRRNYENLNQMYSKEYISSRFKRLFIPYIIIYYISVFLVWILFITPAAKLIIENTNSELNDGGMSILAILYWGLPISGPGGGFTAVIFQFVLIFPLLYRLYLYSPRLMVIACFIIEFFFFLFISILFYSSIELFDFNFFFYFRILCYLTFFAMGIWIAEAPNITSKRNLFILIAFPFSVFYLFGWHINLFYGYDHYMHYFAVFRVIYAVIIFMLLLKYLPPESDNKLYVFLTKVGKRTYHIFLVQIIFYGLGCSFGNIMIILGWDSESNLILFYCIAIILNLFACLILGELFYRFEYNVRKVLFHNLKKA
ncbi:MAG: acyltransferase family protein [Promethearchaeota archaeon]